MNTIKRIAALALAFALMTTLFTACKSTDSPPTNEPAFTATDGTDTPPSDEPTAAATDSTTAQPTTQPINSNEDITNRYSGVAYLECVSPVLVTVTDYDMDDGEGGTRDFTMQRMYGTWDGLRGVCQKAD
jgi:hypothetical protein